MTDCRTFHDAIHRRLDGELTALDRRTLEAHLATCASCREMAEELETLRVSLLAMPEEPLPSDALDTVWDRTVRSRRTPLSAPWARWSAGLAAAAAAAALLLTPVMIRRIDGGAAVATPITAAQLDRAEHDARLALALASSAMHRTEVAARDRILADEVAPVLRKLPFRRPEASHAPARRDRT